MDTSASATPAPDPLRHPLYRIGHLHGNRWVTLKPADQHAPQQDRPAMPWTDGTIYKCEECEEYVVIAPN
jgi:hypothetical protein